MAADSIDGISHTCMAIAGHAVELPAPPIAFFAVPVAIYTGMFVMFLGLARPSRAVAVARAGPSVRLLPLRC